MKVPSLLPFRWSLFRGAPNIHAGFNIRSFLTVRFRINFWLVVLGLLGAGTSIITCLKQSVLISCCFVQLSRWVVLEPKGAMASSGSAV